MKSSRDVEHKYIDYLSVLCKKQIVCTGPLIADSNDEESSEIIEWLNVRDFRSTIYISFGSECFLTKDQIAEVAKGLQCCDVNFLWVIRFPDGEKIGPVEDELPEGFVERVKGRGLVVSKWAPQTQILGHPSIGGFVSHCGWSSVMESVYFGVPIIAMPMKSEQPINAQLVVEGGVGVGVDKERNGGVYVGEEVAKAINKVMVEKAFYEKVEKVSEMMRDKEEEEMNEAAEHLWRICMKNKKQV
ncbi:hypothetical protein ACS0TY_014530 [Phlomoides rotata]